VRARNVRSGGPHRERQARVLVLSSRPADAAEFEAIVIRDVSGYPCIRDTAREWRPWTSA